MKNNTNITKEFTTIEYKRMLSRIIMRQKRQHPLMIKRFQSLKDFLIRNWKIYE